MKLILVFITIIAISSSCSTSNKKAINGKPEYNIQSRINSENNQVIYYINIWSIEDQLELGENIMIEKLFSKNKRRITKRNWRQLFKDKNHSSANGKISTMICVDRQGIVRYSELLLEETTCKNITLIKNALKASMGYQAESAPSGPEKQCGKLVFNLDLKSFKSQE